MKPSICVACIARQEFRDLPTMLRSVAAVADKVVLVDTGSMDGTLIAAKLLMGDKLIVQSYLDASDEDGRLANFSQARNRALELAEMSGCSHVLVLDADDELLTPETLRRYAYWDQIDAFGVWIVDNGSRWVTHRFWKLGHGIVYEGRAHEYPRLNGKSMAILNDVVIEHRGEPGEGQENSNARNLRMLTTSWHEDGPNPRTAFYLANTHRDAGRLEEACQWYRQRIAMGQHYRDEWLFAQLYLARCLRGQMKEEEASSILHLAIEQATDWCEFHMELAQQRYDHSLFQQAIGFAECCVDRTIPYTELWREPNCYRDRPCRMISWCHEQLGDMPKALMWSGIARRKIQGEDREWDARHDRLEKAVLAKKSPAILTGVKPRIALVRPGAIGDILMTLNLIPAFKAANPDAEIHYYCSANFDHSEALGPIIIQSGVDKVYPFNGSVLDKYHRVINLVGYPLQEGYPEKPMQRHLISYFAQEMGLDPDGDYTLTLPKPAPVEDYSELLDGPYMVYQTSPAWSKYKSFDERKWDQFVRWWRGSGIKGRWIDESEGRTLAKSIAIFANARMHIGIDSFCNHLTHFLWKDESMFVRRVPGVILFGSTSPTGSGYAHNVNLYRGLACQPCYRENPAISRMPRGPCVNPPRASYEDDTPWACMDSIDVQTVVDAVKSMWERTSK